MTSLHKAFFQGVSMIVMTGNPGWRAVRNRLRNPANAVPEPAQPGPATSAGALQRAGTYEERRLRALEGRLAKVEVMVGNRPADGDDRWMLKTIITAVAEHYALNVEELCSRRRGRKVSRARFVAMHLAQRLTQHTHTDIGQAFGRHHTSVFHGLQRVAEWRRREPALRADLDRLYGQLAAQLAPAAPAGE